MALPRQPRRKPEGADPVHYSPEVCKSICDAVANGSNLSALSKREGFPSRITVYLWFKQHPEFEADYKQAKRHRAEWRADQVDQIAADLRAKKIDWQTARFELDAIRWQSAIEDRGTYGQKVDAELSGPEGQPLTVIVSSVLERNK